MREINSFLQKVFSDRSQDLVVCASVALCILFAVEFLDPLYIAEKWIFVYFAATYCVLAAGIRALQKGSIAILALPIWVWLLLVFVWTWSLSSLLSQLGSIHSISFLDRISFAILVSMFAGLCRRRPQAWTHLRWTVLSAVGAASLIGLVQYVNYFFQPTEDQSMFASTFQNVNLGAQGAGLGVIFGISLWFERGPRVRGGGSQDRYAAIRKWILILCVLFAAGYIFATFCRSVWIALALAVFGFVIGIRSFSGLWPILRRGILVFFLVVPGLMAIRLATFPTFDAAKTELIYQLSWFRDQLLLRDGSSSNRKELLLETMKMIKDHPFGIGPDQFVFTFPLYQAEGKERVYGEKVYRSPHNEVLRIVSEEGIVSSAVLLILVFSYLFYLTRQVLRRVAVRGQDVLSGSRLQSVTVLALTLYVLSEMAFQFPMDVPYTFFVWSLCLGGSLSTLGFREWRPFSGIQKSNVLAFSVCVLLAAIMLGQASRYVYATRSLRGDRTILDEDLARACEIFPGYWPACSYHSFYQAKAGDPKVALLKSEAWLTRQPGAFPFLKYWSFLMLRTDQRLPACRGLYVFMRMMHKAPDVEQTYVKYCGGFPMQQFEVENVFERYQKFGLRAFGAVPIDQSTVIGPMPEN